MRSPDLTVRVTRRVDPLRWTAAVCGAALGIVLAGCQKPPQSEATAPASEPVVDVQSVRTNAEAGQADAQKTLGDLYASGRGVPQSYKDAVTWYTKAARQGNAAAENSLGELCEAGQGLPFSYATAAEWYKKAAEQGNASAAYNLAVLNAFGRGIKLNEPEAIRWYRKAAEQGNALAQYNLGQRYQLGKGVPQDPVEAFAWLSLAAKTIPDAAKPRDECRAALSREQLSQAQGRLETLARGNTAAASGH